jgi:UDP-N-acetylmuramoylalanine--D-glutamate ligase
LEQAYKKSHIKTPYTLCKNLKTATNLALLHLKSGVILLSPACASFDEFESYKDRGEKFVLYIKDFFERKEESKSLTKKGK